MKDTALFEANGRIAIGVLPATDSSQEDIGNADCSVAGEIETTSGSFYKMYEPNRWVNHMLVKDRDEREGGYGVLEIVIVVSLAVVITTMALVGFTKARSRYELTQRAQNLTSQIERARSIAIKLNRTLTLGFSSDKKTFGITSTDCPEAKDELASITLPSNLQLSAFPTITIRGNGTIAVQGSTGTLTLTDQDGRSLDLTLNSSGRVVTGAVTDTSGATTSSTTSTQTK